MHYYVDGYNLLFRLIHNKDSLQKQREELIQDLESKSALLKLHVTLVFDSYFRTDESSRALMRNLEVCYTAHKETADEFIIHKIKEAKQPSQITVVTSDNLLAWHCRCQLAKTMRVEEFTSWINKRYNNKKRPPPPQPPTLPLLQTKTKSSKAPVVTPKTEEQCFDFYLQTFEEKDRAGQVEGKKIAKKESQTKSRKIKKEEKRDPLLSDFQRWKKAFESDSNKTE